MKEFTRDEISKNNTEKSAWIIIDSFVFDITKFAGISQLNSHASWWRTHHSRVCRKGRYR
jgi:predicted heme/steroid binding protein